MWVANHCQKKFKTQMDTSLNKAEHKQELNVYVIEEPS
jgi:hypothetical protein